MNFCGPDSDRGRQCDARSGVLPQRAEVAASYHPDSSQGVLHAGRWATWRQWTAALQLKSHDRVDRDNKSSRMQATFLAANDHGLRHRRPGRRAPSVVTRLALPGLKQTNSSGSASLFRDIGLFVYVWIVALRGRSNCRRNGAEVKVSFNLIKPLLILLLCGLLSDNLL